MKMNLRKLLRHSKGATAVEYALILALLVIAMAAALSSVASSTISMWNNVASTVDSS